MFLAFSDGTKTCSSINSIKVQAQAHAQAQAHTKWHENDTFKYYLRLL